MDKKILLAAFVPTEKVESFLGYLNKKFSISKDQVFLFKTDTDQIIATFKINVPEGQNINIRKLIIGSIPVHKKGTAIYTINALNLLIEQETGLTKGNIDYKSHKIDWDKYQDKLIIIKNDILSIIPIKRIS